MDANQLTYWTGERIALVVVTLIGMAMCTAGIGKVAEAGRWLSAQGIAGSLLGVVALVVVGARLLDRPLPLVATDRAALVAVLAVVAVKVAIGLTLRGAAWT